MQAAESRPKTGISTALTFFLAAACGVSAANLYYAQPLLHTIGDYFGKGSGEAGLIVTLSQIGYAAGLGFIVPVGDLLTRRRLVPILLLITAAAMAASAAAPSLPVLIALAFVAGAGAVGAQILVPLAASLADVESRGRVVGTVMSGLLLGILLARTVSGLVAGVSDWRVVYVAAAALLVATASVLFKVLPGEGERPKVSYAGLLRSTAQLFATQPLIRRRAFFGGLGFACFSTLWTTIAFLLAGAPYHYGDTVIGLFGLVGAAGALCATAAGNIADRGHARAATMAFSALMLVAFGPIYLGRHSLAWLIVGIIVLDIGVQGLQVTNQSIIYAIAPAMRSRVNSSYMVCYFAGGAIGSAVAAAVYSAGGWAGVCVLGGAVGAVATLATVADALSPTKARPVPAAA